MQKLLSFVKFFYNMENLLLISFLISDDFGKFIKSSITLLYIISNGNNSFFKN